MATRILYCSDDSLETYYGESYDKCIDKNVVGFPVSTKGVSIGDLVYLVYKENNMPDKPMCSARCQLTGPITIRPPWNVPSGTAPSTANKYNATFEYCKPFNIKDLIENNKLLSGRMNWIQQYSQGSLAIETNKKILKDPAVLEDGKTPKILALLDTTFKANHSETKIYVPTPHLPVKSKSSKTSTPTHTSVTTPASTSSSVSSSLRDAFHKATGDAGLIYDKNLIDRFILSLETKPFVILSGLAGSGKTQLALSFAKWICENEDQYKLVAVGADWTNREPLLGYPDALNRGSYVKPENGTLDLLMNAVNNWNEYEKWMEKKEGDSPLKPYFLILDEMNLSYVERYFADFLSAMESKEPIALIKYPEEYDEAKKIVPEKICLPKNLFIVGTINVDETTYMFSPKVLDRANTIEFRVREIGSFFDTVLDSKSRVEIKGVGRKFAEDFVRCAVCEVRSFEGSEEITEEFEEFFNQLQKVFAEYGYRTAIEMLTFVVKGKGDITFEPSYKSEDEALIDAQIVQKLLPKLHGSRKKVGKVLEELWGLCKEDSDTTNITDTTPVFDNTHFKYLLSAEKIWRMYRLAVENGFTSFAEA